MSPSPAQVLECWERGGSRHPLDRALLLVASALPGCSLPELAEMPLARRDQQLLALHRAMFGPGLPGYVDCPACNTRLEFTLDAETLGAEVSSGGDTFIEIDGLRIRRPTSRDLASVIDAADPPYRLAQRLCADADGELPVLTPAQVSLVESALEQADAATDIALNFCCAHCDAGWQTGFDIGDYLWREIDARAQGLLADVHTLARAYGWSERDVLALSDARRAAYIDRVLA
ncbi:MAG: hypothetical protein ACSLE5_10535 [Porticoccaceae bacterium]